MRLPHAPLATLPVLAALGLLVACGQAPSAPIADPAPTPHSTMPTQAITPLLTDYFWDLMAMHDARGQAQPTGLRPDQPAPRLQFDGVRLSLQRLCNTISGGYSVADERLRVQHLVSTKRACLDPALTALETRMAAQLPQVQRHALRPAPAGGAPALTLFFADGSRWEFSGTPTPATRFGTAGERIFLEVAPERAACDDPAMPGALCLRVRDVRYGDNGARLGVGEWRTFQGEIEGYAHEGGMRQVLRVTRFKRQDAPADAPSYAYVLDMVVETERVR